MTAILVPLDPNLTAQFADGVAERRDRMARMTAATLSLDGARALRDDKMAQALDHAERVHLTWGERALDYLKWYAETHDRFPGWFVTQAAELCREVPTPPTLKAWGSIFTKAARLGWIVKDGYRQDPHRHANPCPTWKSMIYGRGARDR